MYRSQGLGQAEQDIDLIIYKELSGIFSLDESMTAKEAFKMVDAELDFLFDILYTKTMILQIQFGFILRFIYFLSSTGALVAFSYANTCQQNHSKLEVSITYLLLLEASFADSIAAVSHLLSNWTMQWLTTPTTWQHLPKFLRKQIAWCLNLKMPMQGQGVKFMGQHSFLNYCLKAKVNKFNAAINNNMVTTRRILKVFWNIQQHAWVDVNPSWAQVDPDLKDLILSRLQQKCKKYQQQGFKFSLLPHLAKKGASDVLKDKGKLFLQTEVRPRLCTTTSALLRAHITEPKYGPGIPDVINIHDELQWSINNGISKLRYKDTCFEAMELFAREMETNSKDLTEVATTLLTLDVEARTFLFEEHGQAGKSVFFKGCELAKQLQSFVVNARWDAEELWEMINCVWTEMLFSAAYDCDWKEHAFQLGQGGECSVMWPSSWHILA
ncbi:hypothetical protein CCACVL1_18716 [Corchorus capsularis]|uniref:DUF4220 domain-containing protein n=1 Tax=Corchorus capsularis TaxID=210143 RepID=A0A1R3HK22_COCAP|nr:hypothetical protein CCACVL1_18716 [Corchorus capsularis]